MVWSIVSFNLALCLLFIQLKTVTSGRNSNRSSKPRLSDFTCGDDGYYANPDDCLKFYRCASGVKYSFDCPPGGKFYFSLKIVEFFLGTSWHADRGLCDYTDLSKCGGGGSSSDGNDTDSSPDNSTDTGCSGSSGKTTKGYSQPHFRFLMQRWQS